MERLERKEREFNMRRAEILEKAEKIFSVKGYHNVTMAEIASASGFSTGSLYQFFEGKENLYSSMISEKLNLMYEKTKKATDRADNVLDKIEMLVDAQLRFLEENADFCRLFIKGESTALSEAMTSMREKIIKDYFKYIGFIENLLKEGIQQKRLKNLPAGDMAQSLVYLIRAVSMEWMLSLKNESPYSKKGFILDIFLMGLKIMIGKKIRILTIVVMIVFSSRLSFAQEVLSLEASIDLALKNSNILNIAKEGLNSATAQKREALTGFLPKFSTAYSYSRLNEAPFSRFQGLPPGPMYDLNGMETPVGTKDNYNWIIEARQPLFAGGGILANYQASSIGEEVARLEETARIQDVVRDVEAAYFNILRAQKINEATAQSVEMLKAHRDVAENYFKVGLIPKNDLLFADVELANGRQALVRTQNAVELAKSRLNTLLKRDISAPVDVMDILAYQPLKQTFEECLETARRLRPEMKISSLKVQQAGKLVRMSQSEYYPALSLVGNYTRFGDEASVHGSDFKDAESWYIMAVANWNFWEWGRTKFRVDASKARENQASESSKELIDQIALEIKNAYLLLQEAQNQISVSETLIKQAEENFRISEERYKERVATSTEVLDAQTLLTRAKSEYASALGDYNIRLAHLQRAMGNIWP